MSILFCEALHRTEHLAERWLKNSFLRAAAGGLVIVLATLALGTTDYNGAGMDVIQRAVEQGQADGWAWLLKLAFTAVTIGCGFKGGEVVPSFFVGATFGCCPATAGYTAVRPSCTPSSGRSSSTYTRRNRQKKKHPGGCFFFAYISRSCS